MGVLTNIKGRSVNNVLAACMDVLTGFPYTVNATFHDPHIQHNIVHMIRNSTKFISSKDLKAVYRNLKEVYSTANAEDCHQALEEFGIKMELKIFDEPSFMGVQMK